MKFYITIMWFLFDDLDDRLGGYHWLPSKSDFCPPADKDFSPFQLVGNHNYFCNMIIG